MSTNEPTFYVTGGTLRHDALSYVERQADHDLFDGLLKGEFSYVLTSRQMGKSSLMIRTANRLREQGANVVALDLTAFGQNLTPEQWYGGMLLHLGSQLGIEDNLDTFWWDNAHLSPVQRWFKALEDVVLAKQSQRLVIFVDEIDIVRSLPFSSDEFFAAIRECYNRRSRNEEFNRLTFCLLGVATPSDLIRDTRLTPFNIGRRIELTDFTEKEASGLAKGLGRHEALSAALLRRIFYWTNGQPYLTQRLCQAIAEEADVMGPAGVDRLCEALFLSRRARENDDNLLFVRERMLRSEVDRATLLTLYEEVRSRRKRVHDDDTNPAVSILRLSGVVRVVEGYLWVRNRIYFRVFDRDWVVANMPDAEVRRQKVAYRRGVFRAATIASIIVTVMAILVIYARSQARLAERIASEEARQRQRAEQKSQEAEERTEMHRRSLYRFRIGLAQKEQEENNIARLKQLLLDCPADLRGWEWYRLNYVSDRSIATLRGSGGPISSVAFSPDGQNIASGERDFKVRVWDPTNGHEIVALPFPFPNYSFREIASTVFSPDGKWLAAGGDGGIVKVWDAATYAEKATLPVGDTWSPGKGQHASFMCVACVAFHPSGEKLAATLVGVGSVFIWDVATAQQIQLLQGNVAINHVAFSPDGTHVVSGNDDGTIRVWELSSGTAVRTLDRQTSEVTEVAWSPDGRWIASASGAVKVWEAESGIEVQTLKEQKQNALAVAFSPDGKQIAAADSEGAIRVWATQNWRLLVTLRGHSGWITDIAYSPDSKRIVSGGGSHSKDREFAHELKLWDASTTPDTLSLGENTDYDLAFAFGPDSRRIATTSGNAIGLWNLETGLHVTTLRGHESSVRSVAFSPDGTLIASGSGENVKPFGECTVRVWDASTGTLRSVFRGHKEHITSVSFSPDSTQIASGSWDGTIKTWDVGTGNQLLSVDARKTEDPTADRVYCVAFSPEGTRIASALGTGIALWDASNGALIRRLLFQRWPPVTCVAWSRNGKRLVSGGYRGDNSVRVWDPASGAELFNLQSHQDEVSSVAFSPDSQRIVSCGYDRRIQVWDASTGWELLTLGAADAIVTCVAFSPDGTRIASADRTGRVTVWETSPPSGGFEARRIVETQASIRAQERDDSLALLRAAQTAEQASSYVPALINYSKGPELSDQ